MKRLHRKDLFCYSVFNERLNIDFNSYFWTRSDGNVLIDPLPLSEHDRAHIASLGGVAWIVLTNSDHVRATRDVAAAFPGVKVAGPAAERAKFPVACDAWLSEREPLFDWRVYELEGSKTPGELALLLEHTLVTGDLVRANRPASLMLLSADQGLKDAAAAREHVSRLAALPQLQAVLVGDGWPLFADCHESLRALTE